MMTKFLATKNRALQGEQIWQIFADWAIVYTLDSFF
jgi:hypothetical protein